MILREAGTGGYGISLRHLKRHEDSDEGGKNFNETILTLNY